MLRATFRRPCASGEPEGTPASAPVAVVSLARPWKVIVHDDPVTLMTYVVMVFRKVFGYSREKSHELMMQVHTEGRSIVWTGAREQAEMYVQKLHGHLLQATLEESES